MKGIKLGRRATKELAASKQLKWLKHIKEGLEILCQLGTAKIKAEESKNKTFEAFLQLLIQELVSRRAILNSWKIWAGELQSQLVKAMAGNMALEIWAKSSQYELKKTQAENSDLWAELLTAKENAGDFPSQ